MMNVASFTPTLPSPVKGEGKKSRGGRDGGRASPPPYPPPSRGRVLEDRRHAGKIFSCSLVLTAIFLAALLWGCRGREDGSGKGAPPSRAVERKDMRGDIEAGKAVYEKYCRYCHGEKGLGDGVVATALTPHPADFVNDTTRMSRSDEELLRSITDGIQRDIGGQALSMPAWKSILTEKERHDVLAYVRKLERDGRGD